VFAQTPLVGGVDLKLQTASTAISTPNSYFLYSRYFRRRPPTLTPSSTMTTNPTDISSLTADQQSALQQYTAVTNQEVEAAIPLLQRSQWNVQIAISRFFDGEPTTDPVAEALAAQAPQDVRRQEVLMNGFSSSRTPRDPNLEPAPRIVPPPDGQAAQTIQAPLVLRLLLTPFNLLYAILSKSFGLVGWIFPFLPRLLSRVSGANAPGRAKNTAGRRPLKPRDSAARFIREFEEEYGPNELPFVEDGYAQALDAAKKDLKFLLVLLVSPEHDDTAAYVRDTLLSPDVVNLLKNSDNNIILWAGSVQDSEAYQVADGLKCSKFPFAALICHTPAAGSTAMSIVARLTGPMAPVTFLSKIQQAVDQHSPGLTRTRRTRQEQQASRNIREQQNSAYERSLAQDRERARLKREAEDRRRREEEETRRAAEEKEDYVRNLEKWRRWRAASIGPEPGADVKDAVRMSLRMPDGARVLRKFAPLAPLEELYAFVECYDALNADGDTNEKAEAPPSTFRHEYKFQLVSPMPREVYALAAGGTIRERIGRSGNLIVERTDLDDSDEDDDE
jgi:FAS-associated factor 2